MANIRSAWSLMTPMLLFSCFCLLIGDMLFGYDTGSFGGILANPGFVNQFGQYDSETQLYAFPSLHISLLSSIPFIGKFIGCFVAGQAIERFGHRIVFFVLSVISCIGVIIEITAAGTGDGSGRFAQFLIGRLVVYISIGLVEVDVTTYQAEIVPGAFRGFVVVSLQLFLNAGSVLATGINKAYSTSASGVGWKTVTGIQFVFPVVITVFTFFIPSSPRWLLSKDREEDAISALRRLRPKGDDAETYCKAEIEAIREALQEKVHKGNWLDLLRGNNLRRTLLVVAYYFFQQATGQAFVSTYQTTFYKENGYEAQAFTYPVINGCLSLFSVIPGMLLVDSIGRRYTLEISYFFQAFWMYLLAGLGELANKTSTESNTVVAAFMLYSFSYNMGGAGIPYLLGGEIPNAAVREKTQAIGTSWNVIWAFVTNFVIPYMIEDIHFGVGWVFGSISLLSLIFTFFFLPETKGRALEELDAIFSVNYSPFRPREIPITEAEHRVAELEADKQATDRLSGSNEGHLETINSV